MGYIRIYNVHARVMNRMRKWKAYSVNDKLGAVNIIKKDETLAKVAKGFGIPELILCGWKKDEEKLRNPCYPESIANVIPHSINLLLSNIANDEKTI